MKKLCTLLLSITLLLIVALAGFGCSSTPTLSFRNNFTNNQSPTANYQETLTYKVNYFSDGIVYKNLAKSSVTDKYILAEGIAYDGELQTIFKVGTKNDIPQSVVSDILTESSIVSLNEIYVFESRLNITATYQFLDSDTPKTVNDTIVSKVYFLPTGFSFAPIYSTYSADMHCFNLSSESKLYHVQYDYVTTYNLNNYVLDRKVVYLNENGEETSNKQDTVKQEYTFKTAIDNNQLLFAVRNIETSKDATTRLDTLAPAYQQIKSLSLSSHVDTTYNVDFKPYEDAQDKISTREFSISVSEQNARGFNQYFTVQTKEGATLKSKALLVKYAQPLYDYGTNNCMGALEFKLTNLSTND